MFFIPIAVIIFFIYFVFHCVDIAQTTRMETSYEAFKSGVEMAKSHLSDESLEWELREHGNGTTQEVVDFMGGGKSWETYMKIGWMDKWLMVAMAKKGKLPEKCLSYTGYQFPGVFQRIMPDSEWRRMNVQFMLRIQQYLRTNYHYPVSVSVEWDEYEDGYKRRRKELDALAANPTEANYYAQYTFLIR